VWDLIKHARSESTSIAIVCLNFLTCFYYVLFAGRVAIWSYTQESEVGTATPYGLGGLGIESRWRRDFPCPCVHPASCMMGLGFSPGLYQLGPGADHPPQYSADVAYGLELYLCLPFVPA
jgi:hypothetical protein